jgi:hypothetical protein
VILNEECGEEAAAAMMAATSDVISGQTHAKQLLLCLGSVRQGGARGPEKGTGVVVAQVGRFLPFAGGGARGAVGRGTNTEERVKRFGGVGEAARGGVLDSAVAACASAQVRGPVRPGRQARASELFCCAKPA